MLKPKYGNELAFVMGNIVASYGGQLEKKAQLSLSPTGLYGKEDTGGSVDMDPDAIPKTVDRELEDPTILNEVGEGVSLEGDYEPLAVSLRPDDVGEVATGPRSPEYQWSGKHNAPVASVTEIDELTPTIPDNNYLASNPFGEDEINAEMEFEDIDPANLFRDPTSVSLEGEDVEDVVPADVPGPVPTAALVLDRIQKIATYLGEKGDVRSELIADKLLHSAISKLIK